MAKRPIPNGYYAMDVDELRAFLGHNVMTGSPHSQIKVEIDGERYPVIKIVREPGYNGAIVLRVPPSSLDK